MPTCAAPTGFRGRCGLPLANVVFHARALSCAPKQGGLHGRARDRTGTPFAVAVMHLPALVGSSVASASRRWASGPWNPHGCTRTPIPRSVLAHIRAIFERSPRRPRSGCMRVGAGLSRPSGLQHLAPILGALGESSVAPCYSPMLYRRCQTDAATSETCSRYQHQNDSAISSSSSKAAALKATPDSASPSSRNWIATNPKATPLFTPTSKPYALIWA